ncbi:MAG: DmsC/YnfH family molybdoenzyme membrane anchor subunit [Planctomycetota bacterium]
MSTTFPFVNREPEFIDHLLDEQQSLTAVEQFSEWHNDKESETRPAQEKYYQRLLPASAPATGQQFAFEVDLDACSGCKACVVACHTLNGLEEDESWRRVGTLVIGNESQAISAAVQHVTTACHHCEDPGCLNGCPVKAYDKDPITGIVRHFDDQCIGCKYCTMMCPYEVPQYSKRLGIVRKCDMCHQRLSVGEAPACVQSCPNEAIRITIVPRDGVTYGTGDAVVPTAPASSITRPTTRYTRGETLDATSTKAQDENVDEVAESHWPLAIMLVATQLSVGMLLAEVVVAALLVFSGQSLPTTSTLAVTVVAFTVGNIGLGLAPLHLGQPLRMWRVFLGLRTSWLSREAVVLGKYMGALTVGIGLYALPVLNKAGWLPESLQFEFPDWLSRSVLIASLPLGVAGLYCSAKIYIATERQLWRSQRTLPRFFGTAIGGGTLFTALVLAAMGTQLPAAMLCLFAAGIGCFKLVSERRLYGKTSAGGDHYDQRSRRLITDHLNQSRSLRFACGNAALGFAVIAGLAGFFAPMAMIVFTAIACFLLAVGDGLERLLYFQSVVYDRMPRTL